MKKSNFYQDLKNQFLYFFVAYELLKTNNLKLFTILFLLTIADVIYNSKNIMQVLTQLKASPKFCQSVTASFWRLFRVLTPNPCQNWKRCQVAQSPTYLARCTRWPDMDWLILRKGRGGLWSRLQNMIRSSLRLT